MFARDFEGNGRIEIVRIHNSLENVPGGVNSLFLTDVVISQGTRAFKNGLFGRADGIGNVEIRSSAGVFHVQKAGQQYSFRRYNQKLHIEGFLEFLKEIGNNHVLGGNESAGQVLVFGSYGLFVLVTHACKVLGPEKAVDENDRWTSR